MKIVPLKSSKPWLLGLVVTATTLTGTTFLWKIYQTQPDN